MKIIQLTQGKMALVDDADFDWLNSVKWYAFKHHQTFYAAHNLTRPDGSKKPVKMHQLLSAVMGFSRPDHKDGNGLNNQRDNLRRATLSQNQANRGLQANSTSGYKGVHWNKGKRKWQAYIKCNNRRHFLGYFETAVEAARAYDVKAKELFGEFARLNFY